MIRYIFGAVVFLCLCAAPAAALQPVSGSHATQLGCADCHPGTTGEADFSGKFIDCDKCHDATRNLHPIGFAPKREIKGGYRLSPEGNLLCLTCHKLHGGDAQSGYLTDAGKGWKDGRAVFCSGCHGSENVRTNPHSARRGDSRCTFCHKTVPHSKADALATIRTQTVKLCDFCHGATKKDHPKNIDPSLTIPDELPREKDGRWSCVTCHDPHGTTATTHYIRPPYAKFMERGKADKPHKADYFSCKACHTESTEKGIRVEGLSLRYKGDINVLCISCHVTERGHHPTGVDLPPAMKARAEVSPTSMPMDEEGRITCYTCHDNQCDSATFEMTERDYDAKTYKTDLCWNCHDRKEYASRSPHVSDYKKCVVCHETNPVKGLDPAMMAVPLMVCLHCHDVKPHPVNRSHIAKPDGVKIQVDPSLPLSKEGKVVCVTCHNPHEDPKGYAKRLRVEDGKKMCGMCHWK